MKKTLIIVSLIGVSAAFVACKKDYTCECTTVGTSPSGTMTTVADTLLTKQSKKDAESLCTGLNSSQGNGTFSSVVTCALK